MFRLRPILPGLTVALLVLVTSCGGGGLGIVTSKDTPPAFDNSRTPEGKKPEPKPTAAPTATPVSQTRTISIEDEMPLLEEAAKGFVSAEAIPGMAIAVVSKGDGGKYETRYLNYGVASKQTNDPVTEHSIFEIHSISKVFTTVLLAKAITEGKVTLDEPLAKVLPDATFPTFEGQPITLEQLATHRSGLPRDYPGEGGARDTPAALLSYVSGYKLTRAPGSMYEYSNLGFALLGVVDSRLYNASYSDLVKQVITDPLGMPDTLVVLSPEQHTRKVQDYTAAGAPNAGRLEQELAFAGAGGLHSTTTDLSKFLIAAMSPEGSLSKYFALAEQKFEARNAGNGGSGLGWELEYAGTDREYLWKDGAGAGGTTYIEFSRAANRSVVVLTNKGVTNTDAGIPNSPSAADDTGAVLGNIVNQPATVELNPQRTSFSVVANQKLADGRRRYYVRSSNGDMTELAHLASSDRSTVFTLKPEPPQGEAVWQAYPQAAMFTVTLPAEAAPGAYQLTAKTAKTTYSLNLNVPAPTPPPAP